MLALNRGNREMVFNDWGLIHTAARAAESFARRELGSRPWPTSDGARADLIEHVFALSRGRWPTACQQFCDKFDSEYFFLIADVIASSKEFQSPPICAVEFLATRLILQCFRRGLEWRERWMKETGGDPNVGWVGHQRGPGNQFLLTALRRLKPPRLMSTGNGRVDHFGDNGRGEADHDGGSLGDGVTEAESQRSAACWVDPALERLSPEFERLLRLRFGLWPVRKPWTDTKLRKHFGLSADELQAAEARARTAVREAIRELSDEHAEQN